MSSLWRTGAFAGEFLDALVANSTMSGTSVGASLDAVVAALRDVGGLCSVVPASGSFSPSDLLDATSTAALGELRRLLAAAQALNTELRTITDDDAFALLLAKLIAMLDDLPPGQRVVVPGGWQGKGGSVAVMHVVERLTPSSFGFTTINTQLPQKKAEHHAISMDYYPKIKIRAAIRFECDAAKILDEGFWFMLLQNNRMSDANVHGPAVLYESLLPHLAGQQLHAAIADAGAAAQGEWETPQRSGRCFYRVVLSTCRYLLRELGLDMEQRKRVTLALRLQFLVDAVAQIEAREASAETWVLPPSEIRAMRCAIRSTARAAAKRDGSGRDGTLTTGASGELATVTAWLAAAQSAFAARASSSRAEAGDGDEVDLALALEPMARLDPFRGFAMVVDDTNSDEYRGGCSQLTPREFVDVAPEREKLAGGDGWVARAIMRCAAACEEFSDIGRGGGRAMLRKEIALRHTAALVQHTFTELLPAPLAPAHPAYGVSAAQWIPVGGVVGTQRAVGALWAIAQAYTAAVLSLPRDRSTQVRSSCRLWFASLVCFPCFSLLIYSFVCSFLLFALPRARRSSHSAR
jgi:hypothetical protein